MINPFEILEERLLQEIRAMSYKVDSLQQNIKNQSLKDEWLTADEVQTIFKISQATLYRWCNDKERPLKVYGKKGARRFKRSEIDQALVLLKK